MENYFFETEDVENTEDRVYVLIIYDIIDNRKRVRLAKFLQGYGFRIQKSAFEAMISKKLYRELIKKIGVFATEEDSIKVYKIIGKGQVTSFGMKEEILQDTVVIV